MESRDLGLYDRTDSEGFKKDSSGAELTPRLRLRDTMKAFILLALFAVACEYEEFSSLYFGLCDCRHL